MAGDSSQEHRDGRQARVAGHVEVEDQHVGAVRADVAAGVGHVARLGHDLEALLAVEEHPQAAAHDTVVIGDHDLGHGGKLAGRRQAAAAVVALTGDCGKLRIASADASGRRAAAGGPSVGAMDTAGPSSASGGRSTRRGARAPAGLRRTAEPVELRETHISWVFLAGDRAYKLKKPVVLPFVDYGTAERRRAMCEEEVRLNRRLAPDVYLGTRAVIATADGVALAPAGASRRDRPRRRDAAVRRGSNARGACRRTAASTTRRSCAVGRRLAEFHAAADAPDGGHATAALHAAFAENIDTLLATRPTTSSRARSPRSLASRRPSSRPVAPSSRRAPRPAASATATATCAPSTCCSSTASRSSTASSSIPRSASWTSAAISRSCSWTSRRSDHPPRRAPCSTATGARAATPATTRCSPSSPSTGRSCARRWRWCGRASPPTARG